MSSWDDDAQMYGCALAFVYCRETDRFLIELRGKDVRYPGTWGLFGGAAQASESPGQAAARELYEETHYDAKPVRVFTMSTAPRLFCGIFVVPTEFRPRLSKESKSYAWVKSFDDIHPMQPDFEHQRRTYERVLVALRNGVRVPKRVLDPSMAAWFRGSVVVDLHGDPLKMYHGTHFDFSAFDLNHVGHGHDQEGSGFYFTSNPDVASGYQNVPEGLVPNAGPNVMPVYLSIKKPVGNKLLTASQIAKIILAGDPEALYNFGDVAFEGRARVLRQAVDSYTEYDNPKPQIFALNNDFYQNESGKFLTVLKQVTGYDGLIAQYSHNTIAVVFSPTQIKSVFNSGNWSKRNPDITASVSGTAALDLISLVTATVEPQQRNYEVMRRDLKRYEISHNDYSTTYKDYVLMTALRSGNVELYFANSTGMSVSIVLYKNESANRRVQLVHALQMFFELDKSFEDFSSERSAKVIQALKAACPELEFDWGTNTKNFELRIRMAGTHVGRVYGIQTGYSVILSDGIRIETVTGIKGTRGIMAEKAAGKWHVYEADKTVVDPRPGYSGRSYPSGPCAGQEIRLKS